MLVVNLTKQELTDLKELINQILVLQAANDIPFNVNGIWVLKNRILTNINIIDDDRKEMQ